MGVQFLWLRLKSPGSPGHRRLLYGRESLFFREVAAGRLSPMRLELMDSADGFTEDTELERQESRGDGG